MKCTLSKHAIKQADLKGIPQKKVLRVAQNFPGHPVTRHPDQTRHVGEGIAVIVGGGGVVITVYLDRVLTPLRPDQIERGETIIRKS